MQEQRMIVLGLIATGLRHGFEMEKFAEDTNLRAWARLGASTIYKVLRELERDGAIKGRVERGERGPKRRAYTLTSAGKQEFEQLVLAALGSAEPAYSVRVAGMVFAPSIGRATAEQSLISLDSKLAEIDQDLEQQGRSAGGDRIAHAVIQYYRDVYVAERAAAQRILNVLRGP